MRVLVGNIFPSIVFEGNIVRNTSDNVYYEKLFFRKRNGTSIPILRILKGKRFFSYSLKMARVYEPISHTLTKFSLFLGTLISPTY